MSSFDLLIVSNVIVLLALVSLFFKSIKSDVFFVVSMTVASYIILPYVENRLVFFFLLIVYVVVIILKLYVALCKIIDRMVVGR